jgi:hypothetical protein
MPEGPSTPDDLPLASRSVGSVGWKAALSEYPVNDQERFWVAGVAAKRSPQPLGAHCRRPQPRFFAHLTRHDERLRRSAGQGQIPPAERRGNSRRAEAWWASQQRRCRPIMCAHATTDESHFSPRRTLSSLRERREKSQGWTGQKCDSVPTGRQAVATSASPWTEVKSEAQS